MLTIDIVNRVLPLSGRYSGRNGADAKSAAIMAARWQHPVNNVYRRLEVSKGGGVQYTGVQRNTKETFMHLLR